MRNARFVGGYHEIDTGEWGPINIKVTIVKALTMEGYMLTIANIAHPICTVGEIILTIAGRTVIFNTQSTEKMINTELKECGIDSIIAYGCVERAGYVSLVGPGVDSILVESYVPNLHAYKGLKDNSIAVDIPYPTLSSRHNVSNTVQFDRVATHKIGCIIASTYICNGIIATPHELVLGNVDGELYQVFYSIHKYKCRHNSIISRITLPDLVPIGLMFLTVAMCISIIFKVEDVIPRTIFRLKFKLLSLTILYRVKGLFHRE